MRRFRQIAVVTLFAVLILSLSLLFAPTLPRSGPSNAEWSFMNANQQATNFVQQSQINEGDVANLQLKWTFQFPSAATVTGVDPKGVISAGQGVISPPLVVNGTVYLVTNSLTVIALDGQTGSVLWEYSAPVNATGLPISPQVGHMHGINYYKGEIWVSLPDCSVQALDALTGSLVMKISRICEGIPGNAGMYRSSGVPPVFYKNTMIWQSSVSEGTDAGRGFVAAYNLTSRELLWRWYVAPPAGGDLHWDTDQCPSPCQGNVRPVNGDWGVMGFGNKTLAGAAPSFGDSVVDMRRGVVYVSTSQASADWNGTFRPGPNLFSDSIVALNVTNGGKMLWYFQSTPHDLYDFDCGWNMVLGNVTLNGNAQEAVFKACKNGYLYSLNAVTGKLFWYFDPPSVARSFTQNANYVVTGNYSGTQPWLNYPSTQQFRQCPGDTGAIESDIAFAYGKIYVATHNFCTFGRIAPVSTVGGSIWGIQYLQPDSQHANTTIYAVDANTGKAVWSHFIPSVPYRGWLTASGGIVFASSLDGSIHALDANDGHEVSQQYLGPSLYEGPTLGATATGTVYLYQLVGSVHGTLALGAPGALMAFAPAPGTALPWQSLVLSAAVVVLAVVSTALFLENRKIKRGS